MPGGQIVIAALAGQAWARIGHGKGAIGIAGDDRMGMLAPARSVILAVQLARIWPAARVRDALTGAMCARNGARRGVIAHDAEFVAVLGGPVVPRVRDGVGPP